MLSTLHTNSAPESIARLLEIGLDPFNFSDSLLAILAQRLVRRILEQLPRHRLEDVIFRLMRDYGQEEAARRNRIALIGLRGAGKTTLGRRLATELGFRFVELDATAWSNNTVRVMARNISGATFDLAAATLSVGVVKRRVP